MSRSKNLIRPTTLHVSLPEDVRKRMDDHLGIKDGKNPPRGVYQKFLTELINEATKEKHDHL